MRWSVLLWVMVAAGSSGCGEERLADGVADPDNLPPTAASVSGPSPAGVVLPPRRPFDSNPLGLPGRPPEVEEGQRVFAVPQRMLAQARQGSSLVLRAATVRGREGNDLVVRVGTGIPYPVHPAYVVVPRPGRMGRGTPVFAAYRGVLRHGVVKNLSLDRVVVRYTDLGFKLGDQKLVRQRIGVLQPGRLMAGGQAVARQGGQLHHVQLVSVGVHSDGKKRWLVIGHGGAAQLVEETALIALPPRRFKAKLGTTVLAAWRGGMVPAELLALDRPGLFTVKRQRTSRRLLVGPGMIMEAGTAKRR